MTKNLDLFNSIRRFFSAVVDSNPSHPVFRLRDLQAFIKNKSSLGTCRTYLYMLSRIGFVESTVTGHYRILHCIPDNFTSATLHTIYANHTNSPEVIVTPKAPVFEPLKDFIIGLSKTRPLDEVFSLSEIQAMVNPSQDKTKNQSISYYISLLCKAKYLNRVDSKIFEVINPVPTDLTSFRLREISAKAEPSKNKSRASKLYNTIIDFLLELEHSGQDEFTRKELVSCIEQQGYTYDSAKISNYLYNLKCAGYIEVVWPKQYKLLKSPFKG